MEGEGHESGFGVLEGYQGSRVGCISTRRTPPEEECGGDGSGGEGEDDGLGPPQM